MISSAFQYRLCVSTIDNKEAAKILAKKLLKQKLVACVNITDRVTSMYYWQDEITEEQEFLLLMKTSSEKISELQAALLSLHPYDIPEFLVFNIEDGSPDYLNWINSVLS